MTEQKQLVDGDVRMYDRGVKVSYSSCEDGTPDCGVSIGLGGGRMLYLGERPHKSGWTLCVYSVSGPTLDIAEGIDVGIGSDAMDAMDLIASTINKPRRPALHR